MGVEEQSMKHPTFAVILTLGVALAVLGTVRLPGASVRQQKAAATAAGCGEKPTFPARTPERVTHSDPAGIGMCFE
jgi:hypothetical protein